MTTTIIIETAYTVTNVFTNSQQAWRVPCRENTFLSSNWVQIKCFALWGRRVGNPDHFLEWTFLSRGFPSENELPVNRHHGCHVTDLWNPLRHFPSATNWQTKEKKGWDMQRLYTSLLSFYSTPLIGFTSLFLFFAEKQPAIARGHLILFCFFT